MIRAMTFGIGVFLAAFLSFAIQPLAGKHILHLAGGTPQSWLVVLTFFQSALLLGYAYVYATRQYDARLCAALPCLLLIFSWLMGPSVPPLAQEGSIHMFILLWRWLGVPMAALGTLAPLLQRLYADGRSNPYRLYALSNAGSLLGLLLYPFFIEARWGLSLQGTAWRFTLPILALVAIACAAQGKGRHADDVTTSARPDYKKILMWFCMAALPASLLSSTTLVLTSAIGSFPLMWVLPLALYLVSFIVAFDGRTLVHYEKIATLFLIVGFLLMTLGINPSLLSLAAQTSRIFTFAFVALAFVLAALLCHMRLYDQRPDAKNLPLFYLVIAASGMLGGAVNAFITPLIFREVSEYYIGLALVMAVLAMPTHDTGRSRRQYIACGAGLLVFFLCVLMVYVTLNTYQQIILTLLIVSGFVVTFLNIRVMALTAVLCLLLPSLPYASYPGVLDQHRNFFGITRVIHNEQQQQRIMVHGNTLHGSQPDSADWRGIPVSYYSAAGPVGSFIQNYLEGDVAVIGLGTGQMACYATPQRKIDFYEIDPDMVTIAKRWFNYLSDCKHGGDIIIGDARRTLNRSTKSYDVMVFDAFSSDDIPAHLLTVEALRMYMTHLRPGGAMAFHISNRFFNLAPVLAANAGMLSLNVFHAYDLNINPATRPYDMASNWVVLSANPYLAGQMDPAIWATMPPVGTPWTDDFTPVLSALQ